MLAPRHYLLWICGLSLLIYTHSILSKEIFKCTGEDGSLYFTDTACPVNTKGSVELIDMPETTPQGYDPTTDYYSIENQARRMKQERLEREAVRADLINKRQALQRLHEAETLRDEAQQLKDKASRIKPGEVGRSPKELKAQAQTLERKAKMLVKEADIISGTNTTEPPDDSESFESEQAQIDRINVENSFKERNERIQEHLKRSSVENEVRIQKRRYELGLTSQRKLEKAVHDCRMTSGAICQ